MKKYKVNVNGTDYEIVLEVINESEIKRPQTPPLANTPSAPSPTPISTPSPSVSSSGRHTITSPMPGNILAIHVTAGKSVKKGEVLMILEAMKMENEIMAPCDGKVASVHVTKGATVESGTLLCILE